MSQTNEPAPPGQVEISGKRYMTDARGALVPIESVRPLDLLMDQTVRKILGYAAPLNEQIARFKAHTFSDISAFVAIAAEQYNAKHGGQKGNVTLISYDGCLKVQVQIADRVDFGPELQIAKTLVDECLREWAAESGVEIRTIVERAFRVDQGGKINMHELLSLLRLEIADERWKTAMKAIRDSMRVVGSKEYVRFYRRATPEGEWSAVTIDLAAASSAAA